jgi:hypothetical protein
MLNRTNLFTIILITVLATIFSALTLWLLDSWIKYPFFVLEIFTIIVLYLIVCGYNFSIVSRIKIGRPRINLWIDVFLVVSASILLILTVLDIQGGLIQLIIALLVTSVLPGFALLNLTGLNRYLSKLECLVLAFVLSFVFTGLMTLGLLLVNDNLRVYFVFSGYILLGVVSLLKNLKIFENRDLRQPQSFTNNIDLLGIIIALSSLGLSYSIIYPGFALISGTDISQHYGFAVLLWRSPELYSGFTYFLAHLHESAFIVASAAPMPSVQTTLATLNLIIPLAFYAMAKSYLEHIDRRLPVLSTIFFSIFSGFAWIYLAQLKLTGTPQSVSSLFTLVNNGAYNGAMYLAQPFLYYVPLSISFTIFIVQFMLLSKLNLGKKSFVALFALLTVASYMTHVTEAIIFSLFLAFYAFFSRSKTLRLNDAIIASLIGFGVIDVFYAVLQYLLGKILGFSLAIPFGATAVLTLVFVYRTFKVQDKLIAVLPKLKSKLSVKLLLYITTFVYILGLIAWISGIPSFQTSLVSDVGSLPWFIYPVFLGVGGVLMMVSFYYLLEDHESMKFVMPFLALLVFSLLFGRALTFINVNLFNTGYWEKRFTTYFFFASAIIAPIALIKVVDLIKHSQARIKRVLLIATVVSIIAVYGLQSFFVVTEYWSIETSQANQLSQAQLQAVDYLGNILQQDKSAYVITLTSASYSAVALAGPRYQLFYPQFFYSAENPEIPLFCLKAHNYPHAYLYIDNQDLPTIDAYSQSWLINHLLPMVPVIYRNPEVTIYNVSSVSFPQPSSTTALSLPLDKSISSTNSWLYAYDLLSMGEYSYTTAYDMDSNLFSYGTVVSSIDPPSTNIVEKTFDDNFSSVNGWQQISGTWQYTENGLEAGEPSAYEDAVSLSPVLAENFTASINFSPIDCDQNVSNYVSLIYDWQDKANYNCAELLFDSTGNVYASFVSNVNDQATNYPAWPGLNTGLKWQLGDSFNLTASVQGAETSLYINGSQYLSMQSSIMNSGSIGLESNRFYQTLFTDFKVLSATYTQSRNIDDYLSYVKNGGNLIVLNTNGYGYFADQLFKESNQTITTDVINGSDDINLSTNIVVPEFLPKNDSVTVLASYTSPDGSSVYAVKEIYGAGEIIYVNVYPIINSLDQSSDKTGLYEEMGSLLKPVSSQLQPFKYSFQTLYTFKQVTLSGIVNVSSSSLLFPSAVNFSKVSLMFATGRSDSFDNVTQVALFDYNSVSISSSNLTLSNGSGFYSSLSFGDNITIRPNNNSTFVLISTKDGTTTISENDVKEVSINGDSLITLLARQPTVNVQGLTMFKELYSNGELYQETQSEGQDLTITGSSKMTIYLSDTYTWASSLNVSGSMNRTPPIIGYDELSSVPEAISWSLVLIPIFLIAVILVQSKLKYRK